MPYDPPNQAAWQHDGILGYAAYKVADSVKTHEGWGLGSYCFLNVDPTIHASHAFEVPATLPPGSLNDLLTIFLDATNGKEVWKEKYAASAVTGPAVGKAESFKGPRSTPAVGASPLAMHFVNSLSSTLSASVTASCGDQTSPVR